MENKPLNHEPHEKFFLDQPRKGKNLLHYRDLKFYMKQTMKVMQLYTVYLFRQPP